MWTDYRSRMPVLSVIPQICSLEKPASQGAPVADSKLLTPLKVPRAPMCVGKNYHEHVKEVDSWKGPGITEASVPKVSRFQGGPFP